MRESLPAGEPRNVVDEVWYEYFGSAVVEEGYADGGVQFFIVNWDGTRRPFSNIKSLNEEGSVVSKEEAMEHLALTKARVEAQAGSDPTAS